MPVRPQKRKSVSHSCRVNRATKAVGEFVTESLSCLTDRPNVPTTESAVGDMLDNSMKKT